MLSAQVNTEKYRSPGADGGFSAAVELEGSFKSGNSEEELLTLGSLLDYITGNSRILFILNGEYNLSGNTKISNEALFHTRYIHNAGKGYYPEIFAQVNFDRVRKVEIRELAGANLRKEVYADSLTSWFAAAGVMQEYEKLLPDSTGIERSETLARGNFYITGSYSVDNIRLSLVTYYQPFLKNFDDYRILIESSVMFGFNSYLAFTFNLNYRYDNIPPPEVKTSDVSLNAGISLIL